jgi:hypothetical protein
MATMTLESAEEIKRASASSTSEHRDLDRAIEALENNPLHDELPAQTPQETQADAEGPDLHASAPAGPDIPA